MSGMSLESFLKLPAEFEVGFAQSRRVAAFVRRDRDSGALTTPDGKIDLSWVFDLRLFHAKAEWHWWWDQEVGAGAAATLNDDAARKKGWSKLGGDPLSRIIRGSIRSRQEAWTQVHDGQARPLWVPYRVGSEKATRLTIGAVEYTAQDEHGNVSVVAERLTQIGEL